MAAGDSDPPRDPARAAADVELVRAVLQGDRDATDRFAERMQCVPRILAFLRRGQPDGDRAEGLDDLVQEVLAAIWRRLPDYRGDAALETWSYRFCVFLHRNAARRAAKAAMPSLQDVGDVPAAAAGDPDDRLAIAEALDQLEPDEAALLRLKHFSGLTFAEIGARLGQSPNTVKTKYYRALQTMARLLDTNGGRP